MIPEDFCHEEKELVEKEKRERFGFCIIEKTQLNI